MIRMRNIMLLFTLLVVLALAIFPEIAGQTLRLDALNWQVETRQGFFVLMLLLLLWLVYALRTVLRILLAGHGRLLLGWRNERMNRHERKLRKALLQWIDGDRGQNTIVNSGDCIPAWLHHAVQRLMTASDELPLPLDEQEEALANALSARLVTDAQHCSNYDMQTQRMHLQAWLKVSPSSLLAQARMARLEMLEGNITQAASMFESLLKKEIAVDEALEQAGDTYRCRQLLAECWITLAEEDEEQRKPLLRKLRRMAPDNGLLVLRIGLLMKTQDGDRAVKKLWLDFLQQHDDSDVADACFDLMAGEAMSHFRQLEHMHKMPAFEWLKARLAHASGLDGLAEEIISALLLNDARAEFLRSQAQWRQEQGKHEEACALYQQALKYCADHQ